MEESGILLSAILALPLAGAVLGVLGGRLPMRWRSLLVPLPALAAFLLLLFPGMDGVRESGQLFFRTEWVPQIGMEFALQLNGLGLLLGLLVTGIGTLILLYATGYMGGHPQAGRLFAFLYAFMFAMVGLALAEHLLLIFIFWELTSVTSYLLIGFQHTDATARKNALQALLVTGMGGMALLAGFILLAGAAGTWNLSELAGRSGLILEDPRYPAILALVLLGAFTKSAQFPFHFWLPNAMSAPTPVSAYLHSATMVKAGVFLLFLMLPVLGDSLAWTFCLTVFGSLTLLAGGIFGLRQHDLKKILAGTTVAVLGLLTLLLGIGTEPDVLAALLFFLGHALYKATLFMVAGSIDHETGTRDARVLGGLRKAMPVTALAALLAAFSKMGLPPFFGFLGKEYTYKASLATELQWTLTAVLLVGNAMILALAVRAAVLPFWRPARVALPKHPHEAPWSMWAGPLILAVLGMVIGSFPHLVDPLLSAAKSAALAEPFQTDVKLWQGFNFPLLLSGFTVLGGLMILNHRDRLENALERLQFPGAEQAYEGLLSATLSFAAWQTRVLQSGSLRRYLLTILGATALLIISKLWRFGGIPPLSGPLPDSPVAIAVAVIIAGSTWVAVTTASRLSALLALGGVGFGVAMIFALYSAPDLAITQVLVETLTVVLFAWVVSRLPGFRSFTSKHTRRTDAVVSIAAGLLVTLLILKSNAIEIGDSISDQLAAWSLPEAYGANVVNVILVDFRALDTWGEITVLGIAALGVWALLTRSSDKPEPGDKP